MAIATDPFTLVYEGIWEMIEAHNDVRELIAKGNIIKYVGARDRMLHKPALAEADVPELRLMIEKTDVNLNATSNSTLVTEALQLALRGGSLLYDRWLNPVRWAVLRSMGAWADHLAVLEWNSKRFVVHGLPLSLSHGLLHPEEDGGGKMMWLSLLRYEVRMAFDNADFE